jgi:hypothetical protein
MANPRTLNDGETSFGVFYPKDYVVAVFAAPSAAERAAAALEFAGFDPHDVLVVGSDEVLTWHGEFNADAGLVGRFKQFVSRHFGNEAGKLSDMVEHARLGHAFVLAYAPDDAQTKRAANTLRPAHPTILRKFNASTIADLT